MNARFTQLYMHLVRATWDRLPLMTSQIEPLYSAIAQKCRGLLRCLPVAIGGTADHVHVLAQIYPTVSVSTLVREMKGSSSHLVTHRINAGEFFKWQGTYGAFTLRTQDVPILAVYIERQKEHHASGSVQPPWEQAFAPDADEAGG